VVGNATALVQKRFTNPFGGLAVMIGGKIAQQVIVPGRRQLLAWPRVYGPAIFQQSEEEVRAEANASMADDPHLITGGYRALSQRRRNGRKVAIHADITFVLDQHLQSTGTATFNTEQLA
jgi:hypothetical protein